MDYRFVEMFANSSEEHVDSENSRHLSDFEVIQLLKLILLSDNSTSTILNKAIALLTRYRTVKDIAANTSTNNCVRESNKSLEHSTEVLYRGTPAMCLTFGEF